MMIVAAVLAIVAGAAVWYWRSRNAAEAASAAIDAAEHLRGAYKRRKFRSKAEGSAVTAVDDPAIAALTFLVALANLRGPMSRAVEDAIKTRMGALVGRTDLEEDFIHARWVADHVVDLNDLCRKFASLWRERLSADEQRQFAEVADAIAASDGAPTELQRDGLKRLRATLPFA
jgi:hypothetical protein